MQTGKITGHIARWNHGKEAFFSDLASNQWCRLMCGILHFFCEEFQVVGLEALLDFVQQNNLYPETCAVNETS